MPENERLVQVRLLGQEFSFYTAEPEENVEKILKMVRSVLEEDFNNPKSSLLIAQQAVLGCLTIASSYISFKEEVKLKREDEEGRICKMKDEINQILDEPEQ